MQLFWKVLNLLFNFFSICYYFVSAKFLKLHNNMNANILNILFPIKTLKKQMHTKLSIFIHTVPNFF